METLKMTLVSDGTSDRALKHPLGWLLGGWGISHEIEFADLTVLPTPIPPANLLERCRAALQLRPCQILAVHRDAEKESWKSRAQEISAALGKALAVPYLRVVPVRMTEAWLLISEQAIRKASGNPHGTASLGLPATQRLESLPNPKEVLHAALQTASELPPQRRRRLRLGPLRQLVAQYIEDYEPLLKLTAFRELESELRRACDVVVGNGDRGDAGTAGKE